MNTQRMITPFWERRWLILATTLTVIVGTLCWARGLPHAYESAVVLAATSKDGKAIPPGQVPRLYRELWSPSVINPVVQADLFKHQRESGATTEVLVKQLRNSTSLREDHQGASVMVHLHYLDLSPEAAEAGANLLGQAIASAEIEKESENNFAFRVVRPAISAAGPIKPRLSILTFYALGGGLLLGLVLAGMSELFKYRRHVKFDSPSVRAT